MILPHLQDCCQIFPRLSVYCVVQQRIYYCTRFPACSTYCTYSCTCTYSHPCRRVHKMTLSVWRHGDTTRVLAGWFYLYRLTHSQYCIYHSTHNVPQTVGEVPPSHGPYVHSQRYGVDTTFQGLGFETPQLNPNRPDLLHLSRSLSYAMGQSQLTALHD